MSTTVRLHRTNRSLAISTNASTEDEFVKAVVTALCDEIGLMPDDPNGGPCDQGSIDLLHAAIPHVIEIAAKLRGYKRAVIEHRVLGTGSLVPDDIVDEWPGVMTQK